MCGGIWMVSGGRQTGTGAETGGCGCHSGKCKTLAWGEKRLVVQPYCRGSTRGKYIYRMVRAGNG